MNKYKVTYRYKDSNLEAFVHIIVESMQDAITQTEQSLRACTVIKAELLEEGANE